MKEYWIVDPEKREIALLIPEEGRYKGLKIFSINDTLASPLLVGLNLRVGKIF